MTDKINKIKKGGSRFLLILIVGSAFCLALLGIVYPTARATDFRQSYAYGALPNFKLQQVQDSAGLVIFYDKDIIKVRSIAYKSYGTDNPLIDNVEMSDSEDIYFTFYPVNYIHIFTTRGVTTLLYIQEKDRGYMLVNGRIVSSYLPSGEFTTDLGGKDPDYYKNFVNWKYQEDPCLLRPKKGIILSLRQ